jgi:photosystem II stability/assembly factor-like uncharacterized protein
LSVSSGEVAWASGQHGTVLRTADGGATWQDVSPTDATSCDFRDVEAFRDHEAVVISAGMPARIYRTIDGGQTWTECHTHDDDRAFFNGMAFWPNGHGIAFSDPLDNRLLILETQDRGGTWSELAKTRQPQTVTGEAGFAASGSSIVTLGENRVFIGLGGTHPSEQARVWHSPDQGRSWEVAETPLGCSRSSGIFSLAFAGPRQGIAVGGDYQRPEDSTNNVTITRDGGLTWQEASGSPPRGYRSCVTLAQFGGRPYFIAVGPQGCDVSSDLGENWRPLDDAGFHVIATSPSGQEGWVAGTGGKIARWRLQRRADEG